MANTKELLKRSDLDSFSGFYYDLQLENPALIMTLHPNKRYNPDAKDPSGYWSDITGAEVFDGGGQNEYQKEPIAKAIIGEDFQVGIANQWEDHSFANNLTDFWSSLKPMAPFISTVAKEAPEIKEIGDKKLANEEGGGNSGQKLANTTMGIIGKGAQIAEKFINRAIVVQGSRFSYYNGTGVAFGNLSMKFTLFSDWTSDGEWKSCIDKVQELTPYVIGKYISGFHEITENEIVNDFMGWQLPPGGFSPDLKKLDTLQRGTLMVIFAGIYAIPNLVISEAQFNFSKQMVKFPSGDTIDTCPMYCDVQLTLKPASQYTGESFNQAIGGKSAAVASVKGGYIANISARLRNIEKHNKSIVG